VVVDYSSRSSFELRISRKVSSMTYRELLFKMSEKDMLTLSSDKDGRGLFWAGMNNMEALDREFDWKDFEGEPPPKKEYNIDKQGRKREI
tara:strand:- start:199 stop:468 length:270 start_codon:yes stop_codon:yes gene_type:complete